MTVWGPTPALDGDDGRPVPEGFVGAATMTTLLALRSTYQIQNILVGILLNLFFVYLVLKSSNWIENKLGSGGIDILRKVFGIILLAISIKLFKTNLII